MKGTQQPIKLPGILQKTAKMLSVRGSGKSASTTSGSGSTTLAQPDKGTFYNKFTAAENEHEMSTSAQFSSFFRRKQPQKMIVTSEEITAFFRLFDDDLIQDFLWMDCCAKTADKYLLAMVFAYFKRAQYTIKQYTRMNFFVALYLASDMEEDEEDDKYNIFPWALGRNWRNTYPGFLRKRDRLLRTIQYRAAVSRKCCEEVMSLVPDHIIWKRERMPHHAGAVRKYPDYDDDDEAIPMGPDATPVHCRACEKAGGFAFDIEIHQSPDSGFLYLSSCTDSSTDSAGSIEEMESSSYPKLEELPMKGHGDFNFEEASIWAARDE
ncbi:speedy protein A-like [Lytechinus variegatus]|uniref:speedy protein A-like n=1 Tax=Lytechinus variegatus TaxID=7654 RepID=UPI001BB22240|nr:speedy protein A-like [Lytechinus variegatus]